MALLQTLSFLPIFTLLLHLLWTMRDLLETPLMRRAFFLEFVLSDTHQCNPFVKYSCSSDLPNCLAEGSDLCIVPDRARDCPPGHGITTRLSTL